MSGRGGVEVWGEGRGRYLLQQPTLQMEKLRPRAGDERSKVTYIESLAPPSPRGDTLPTKNPPVFLSSLLIGSL